MVPAHLVVLGVGLGIAVVSDVSRAPARLADAISLGLAAAALALRFTHFGVGDLDSGLLSGLVGALLAAVLLSGFAFRQRGLEWVDVKLLAAAGAGLGYPLVLPAALFISLSGAVLAIVFSIWKGSLSATLQRIVTVADKSQKPRIPYSVAIAVGSAWAVWWDTVSGS